MARSTGPARFLSAVVALIGVLMIVTGGVTYYLVLDELKAANITVAEGTSFRAGDSHDGPFAAYAQAEVIDRHALEATGGQTYAELDREDPLHETAMSAPFLRASLFTSVVAIGVAAMAMGVGLGLVLLAMAVNARTPAAESVSCREPASR